MNETNQSSGEGIGPNKNSAKNGEAKSKKSKKKKWTANTETSSDNGEVLLKVGRLEYRAPGKRQRIIIAGVVLGLNIILVLAVVVYFKNPVFRDLIYTLGR